MISKLKKLNRREITLAIATAVVMVATLYYIILVKPLLSHIKTEEAMQQQLMTQQNDIQAKIENNSIIQQHSARLNEVKKLELEIKELKVLKKFTSADKVASMLNTLGLVENYSISEVDRNTNGLMLNIIVTHANDYTTFKTNIDKILEADSSLRLKAIKLDNNKYTSEWSAWVQK